MNKKQVILLVGSLAVLAIGFGLYRFFKNPSVSPAWRAVSGNAAMVWEIHQPAETLRDWQEQSAWQPVWQLPHFQNLTERLADLQRHPESKRLLNCDHVLVSLHPTNRHDFDYVFYVPLRDNEIESVTKLAGRYRRDPAFRSGTRTFGGEIITEITHRASGQQLSYILLDDVWVGSYTSFLVEDVIRRSDAGGSQWPDWRVVDKVKIGKNPPVTLYVNPKALPGLVQVFTGNAADAGVLGNFGQFSDLAVSPKDNRLVLSGQTHTDQSAATYLSVFEGQRPQSVNCLSLVPSETAVLYRWSFSDAAAFLRNQHRYDSARGLAEGDFPRPNPLWMGREMALAIVETASDQPDRLLCVQATDFTKAVRQVESVAPGTVSENYAGVSIRQAAGAEFPARFFGSVFNGFPECYYAIVGQYLVFGSSVQALKNLLDRRAAGEVWSKSARYQQLLSEKPACFGVYVNPSRAWALFLQRASPHWRKWMQQYANELKDIEAIALDVAAGQNGAFGTEMVVVRREKATAAALLNRFFVNWHTTADTTLIMPPVLVRNHNDGSREMLTQDAAHRLYLFSQSGKILWRRPLENAVQSAVHQVDYLKNNKLQYLFATRTHLQLIDRNGNTVAPYPMRVPTAAALHTLAVVDYDGNRDYRFLVSDLLGNLYMYDKAGNALEGWNPLRTGYRLQCVPQHVRIRDKDYFVALQANGRLLLLNRRGQSYPGFPVDLKTRTDTPFFLKTALSPEETHVVVVSREGEVIQVNFSGETVNRRQLVRTSAKCMFRLCPEPQGRDWVVGRLDSRTLSILDKNGQLLWETAGVPSDDPYLQYYNFGGGRRLMAVTAAGRTSVHTFDGKIVGDESFANRLPLAVVYADAYDKMLLYHTDGRKAGVLSVKIK